MRYVYYASLYTMWALIPVGTPDNRGWWAEMAKFLEECLLVIEFGGDDRFKLKKVNPVVDEGYETGDGSGCVGGFRGCLGDEYSEDEELSELDSEMEGSEYEGEAESEMEMITDDEEHITDEGEVGENDSADEEHVPESVSRDRIADGDVETGRERLRLDKHGHGQRDFGYRAWALKNLPRYGTTFHWDDENGEPAFDNVRCQLWQKVCHDLREIEIKHGGRLYMKPALGFR
ncbi:hypothetical protein ABOM_009203 [Aspergillus bombycis]|uniref:Uncharacterized protein n=1 Tax=Aspergillus bombycis TaxID=109264 RepID=A0A1F7ZVJ1_9EURO|nr:hypothetical protein ABOM_009203 [Aspergillus bombycis]OGM43085.1 hypothetical protein ABOM_009203 [Aspergillus bombycis]